MSGLPDKKARYHLAGENCEWASCLLDGDHLYIWYEKGCTADQFLSSCLRKINLRDFSGIENVTYDTHSCSKFASTLIDCGDHICVSDGGNSVIRKEDLAITYMETEDYLSINGWSDDSHSFFFGGHYYRAVNTSTTPHKGYDVVDIESWSVVRRIDMDMNRVKLIDQGLCYGVRVSQKFAIYSLINSEFIFELDTYNNQSTEHSEPRRIRADYNGEFLAVLCDNKLNVIDPKNRTIKNTISISDLNSLHTAAADAEANASDLCMTDIRFYEDDVILSSNRCIACVVPSSGICRWAKFYPANVSISLACMHGDLIFGSKNSKPHAWDRYTGIEVWSASTALPCLSAQVSDNWVVYHQLAGHITCYEWKKPYISPDRPI